MPVRIIFRGLMLFQFPTTGKDAGKLVVLLVDKKDVTKGSSERPAKGAERRGPWEHHHNPDYQVLSDQGGKTDVVPKRLPNRRMDITIPNPNDPNNPGTGVVKSRSFLRYVPNLNNIIERGTPAVQALAKSRGNARLGEDIVSNIVKVNRGTVFVRDVVIWDAAAYPLSGSPADVGESPRTPALAKFMGSDVQGHMVSEVIVQVDDADTVDLDLHQGNQPERHRGYGQPNPYVPEGTVEIVITNYEYQRGTPVPWSMDFQWLFEVAGYGETDLTGRDFDAWLPFAARYNKGLLEGDRELLLRNGSIGRPFPYLESYDATTPLSPLTNVLERPLCSSGTTTPPIDDSF